MGIGNRIEPESRSNLASNADDTFVPEEPRYELTDLILKTEVLDSIHNTLAFKEHSDLVFNVWGLNTTHKHQKRVAINLYGPPGTGKTMAAHAIAKHLGRKLILINYADIESKYVGDTPKNIVKAFNAAKEHKAILFFDEADAILSRRVTSMNSSTDVSVNQTRSVMLILLNDYQDTILFATNFIENYDPAFMRRIIGHIYFDLPDEECRYKLLKKNIPECLPNDIDISYIANIFEGVSGSDISNAILLSAFRAAKSENKFVTTDFVKIELDSIVKSKNLNTKNISKITDRIVSEEYAISQIGVNKNSKGEKK